MSSTQVVNRTLVQRKRLLGTLSAGLLLAFVCLKRFGSTWPIDPWGLFDLYKIAQMVIAITLIQAIGGLLALQLGARAGALVTGFCGGLISSTAMTASLSKLSQDRSSSEVKTAALIYYAATCAMLLEAAGLVLLGDATVNPLVFVVFFGPLLMTSAKIFTSSRAQHPRANRLAPAPSINLGSVLKLSFFIVIVLGLSKLGQRLLGASGLFALTFMVSLFEIHGSVIANVHLYERGDLDLRLLGGVLATSVLASYVSKLLIVYTIGSPQLAREIRNWTFWISGSLLAGWGVLLLFI